VKKKLLFEEIMQYNKWTSGIASRELGSQRVTLRDLFDKSINQYPNDAKADKVMPYPLPSIIEQLGDLYLNACNAKNMFMASLNNPVVKDNAGAKETVKTVIVKLDVIIKELKEIFGQTGKPVAKK